MKSSIPIRLGGLVAIVGGTASAALGLLYVLEARGVTIGFTEKALQKGHYENPTLTIFLIGVLVAIVALHVMQRGNYGSRGALASFITIAGVVMIVGGTAIAYTTILASVVGILAVSVGVVVLGIVTMMSAVLPRWCGAAVIAGSPHLYSWGS